MIKDFNTYIKEDYFSKLANRKDNGDVRKENMVTEEDVLDCIYPSYRKNVKSISFRKEGTITYVDVDGDVMLVDCNFDEIPFQFGKVTGNFSCAHCENLTSLDGCPKEVGGDFYCNGCENLISVEGCPKEVGGDFYCADCCDYFNKRMVRSLCDVKGKIYV